MGGDEGAASRPRRVLALIALITAALIAAAPCPAAANAGVPSYGGVPVGEVGGLDGVRIVSETLAIDLRPVDVVGSPFLSGTTTAMFGSRGSTFLGASARVTATYQVANSGMARAADLRFAHGADRVTDFVVAVDGRRIDGAAVEENVPEDWRAPRYTPGPDGPESFLYVDENGDNGSGVATPRPWAFRATLPAGPSTLTVTHRADAGVYLAAPLIVRQFAYILAPARTWDGFGTLDVVVDVPAGWLAWSAPALERRGDRLVGRFEGVPADALALSVQPAQSAARVAARWLSLALLALTVLAGGPLCWRIGRQRRRRRPARLGVGMLCGLAWEAAIGLAGWLAVAAPDAVTPPAYISHYGYGLVMAVIGIAGLACVALPLGLASTWLGDRMAPASDAPPASPAEPAGAPPA
ncbi:MAG: hypothetical protein U0470_13145 [Anaerolineae bacterium]